MRQEGKIEVEIRSRKNTTFIQGLQQDKIRNEEEEVLEGEEIRHNYKTGTR